jgi:N-acetylneuraminic acid mutarotase
MHESHAGWTSAGKLKQARDALGLGVIHGSLYAVGGGNNYGARYASVEKFDPSIGLWVSAPNMSEARASVAVGVHGDHLYAVGGRRASGELLQSAERFDGRVWQPISAMTEARRGCGVGVLDGHVYAVGGRGGRNFSGLGSTLSSVEIYDPVKDEWISGPCLHTPRESLAVAVLRDKVYAIGGLDENGNFLDTVEVLDPSKGEWIELQQLMTIPRATHGAAVLDGILYVAGGGSSSVEFFDPAANSWLRAPTLHEPVFGLAVAELNGSLYAVGGFKTEGAGSEVEVLSHKWQAPSQP